MRLVSQHGQLESSDFCTCDPCMLINRIRFINK